MFGPLALKTVRWRPLEGEGLEHLTIRPVDGGIRAQGTLIGGQGKEIHGISYRIDCDAAWRVRHFSVEDTIGRRLELRSDGEGRWSGSDGVLLGTFDGCIDIDLSGSPFTNTLPIRRLSPQPGDGAIRLMMLYVPLDTFEPFVHRQRYTCLIPGRRYLYESDDGSFRAELPVDEDGLVIDYPTLCKRL